MAVKTGTLLMSADRIDNISKTSMVAYIGEDKYFIVNNEVVACAREFAPVAGANCIIMYDDSRTGSMDMQAISFNGKYVSEKMAFETKQSTMRSTEIVLDNTVIQFMEEIYLRTTHAQGKGTWEMMRRLGLRDVCGMFESPIAAGYKGIQVWIFGQKLSGVVDTQNKKWTVHLCEKAIKKISDDALMVIEDIDNMSYAEVKSKDNFRGYIIGVNGERLTQESYKNIKSLGCGLFEVDASEFRRNYEEKDSSYVGTMKQKCVIYMECEEDITIAKRYDTITKSGNHIILGKTINTETYEKRFDIIYGPKHKLIRLNATSILQNGEDQFICKMEDHVVYVNKDTVEKELNG